MPRYHGFVYSNGSYSTINAPRGIQGTYIYGINDLSQMVGGFNDASSVWHGILYTGGVLTQLSSPFGDLHPFGINDAGQIVGWYFDGNGNASGFLRSGNTYIDIDVPGASSTLAMGINDNGQIVGNYIDANGIDHGFLATPVSPAPIHPLPPFASALVALGLFGWLRKRRACAV